MTYDPKNATRLGLGTFPKAAAAPPKSAEPKPADKVKLTDAQQAAMYHARKRRHPPK